MDTGAKTRQSLKKRIFRRCDKDGDGHLKKAEMRDLAGLVGFDGSDEEWAEEYEKLCSEHGIDPHAGVPESAVMALLDDESDSGCYCTDKELMQLLGEAPSAAAPRRGPGDGMGKASAGHAKAEDSEWRVFFAGANFSTEEATLREIFKEAGAVEDFTLFRMMDGRSRGMGRVTYSSSSEVRRAITQLHQREVDGRALLVQEDTAGRGGDEVRPSRSGGGPSSMSKGGKANTKGGGKASGKGKSGKDSKGYSKGGWGSDYYDSGWGYDGDWGLDYYDSSYSGSYSYNGIAVENYYGYDSDGCTVFFAGASFETTAGHLKKQFQDAGRIRQFWLFQLPDGRSRGMGVVQFSAPAEAEYSISLMHGRLVDGREILVKIDDVGALASQGLGYQGMGYDAKGSYSGKGRWGSKGGKAGGGGGKSNNWNNAWSNRVFFAGVPFHIGEREMRSYFEEMGGIRSFSVFWLKDGRHRGMGVCTFETSQQASQVLRDGIMIEGRPLFLQEDISQYNAEQGRPVAPRPVQQMQVATYGGGGSYGGPSQKPNRSARSAQYDQTSVKVPANLDPSKAVFFANVPFETTETHLRSRFETAGQIKSFTLFMTAEGKSRGMGVVEYTTQGAAHRAYSNLHERNVGGRLMIVDEYRAPAA